MNNCCETKCRIIEKELDIIRPKYYAALEVVQGDYPESIKQGYRQELESFEMRRKVLHYELDILRMCK